ncbi:hypothetical protein FKW77_006698 [Venturia effusa]|uniref:Uncharacterized protein n=1 Tax=Venturia effusa TaxID=50376 RepID=A0A517LCG8_9PEZI|nr:hypothetical protein FKW77_006698 [Venturia effusa]
MSASNQEHNPSARISISNIGNIYQTGEQCITSQFANGKESTATAKSTKDLATKTKAHVTVERHDRKLDEILEGIGKWDTKSKPAEVVDNRAWDDEADSPKQPADPASLPTPEAVGDEDPWSSFSVRRSNSG